MLIVLKYLLSWTFSVYMFTGLILMTSKFLMRGSSRVINAIWKWTKWPSLGYVITLPLLDVLTHAESHWFNSLIYVWNGICWWIYRDEGDDDDFKKYFTKVKEKVTSMGGKLVVVPVRTA